MQIAKFIKTNFTLILAALTLLLFLFFCSFKLGSSLFNTDAQHWYLRTQNFAKAVKNGNFSKTYQDPKPGVPVMWLSGFGIETMLTLYEHKFHFRPQLYTFDTFHLFQIFAVEPLIILNALFLAVFFLLIKKLFGRNIALVSLILLALHPYYIANARFLHVDATMTIFITLSFLFFLVFCTNKKRLYLVASGVMFGLALLTKTQAAFFLPVLITLSFFSNENKNLNLPYILKTLFIWLAEAILIYFALFPAMWIDPPKVLKNIFIEAFFVANTGRTGLNDSFYYTDVLYREMGLIFIIPALSAIIFTIVNLIKKKKLDSFNIFTLVFYAITYLMVMTLVKQKVDRYMLPIFPIFAILSAWTIDRLLKPNWKPVAALLIFLFMTSLSLYFMPHFETFGHNTLSTNTYGSLYNEAGRYINSLPNSEDFTVVAMTKAYSLKPFIKGNTYGFEEDLGKTGKLDYLVTNDYWLSEYGKPWYFDKCFKETSIYWRNDLYWDIYKCSGSI